MSDTVKLIIEISKHQYEICKQALKDFGDRPITECEFAIAAGRSLDINNSDRAEIQAYFAGQAYGWEEGRKSLIEDLKAEIYDKAIKDKNGDGFIFLGRLEKIFNSVGKGDKEQC